MSVRVSCPSCGGPVVFEVGSSMVSVCPYCRSVVARGDRSVENLGKVAELVDTGAVLRVGLTGKYEGRPFRLTGRTQLGHEAGGMWDEWYAAFDNDRWGWLSEAQGRYYMLFEQPEQADRPLLDRLEPGREVLFPESEARFVVAEVGTATVKGAEGEIPWRVIPGSTYRYADLSGEGAGFATLDFAQTPPALYLGREVTLNELDVPTNLRRETFELRQVAAQRVNCPNCAGPLDLRAPDRTERVGCPYCGSMLDATQGNLTLLEALKEPPFELLIPLGSKGKFGDEERTVIGALQRSVTVEGVDYTWQEYLLYHPAAGFEWLIRNDNHWTRVKNVPAGDVTEGQYLAEYDGRAFRKFQAGTAVVRGVVGECYWKVRVGEAAETADYIRPPELLSCERSVYGGSREVNWSVGSYLTPAEVQAAFGLPNPLPAPVGVAPNQPFPYKRVYKLAAWFFGGLCALGLLVAIVSPARKVYEGTFQLRGAPPAAPVPVTLPGTNPGLGAVVGPGAAVPPTAAPVPDALAVVVGVAAAQPPAPSPPPPAAADRVQVFHTDLFDLRGRRNLRVTVSCPQLSGYLVVEGDLVQQANGEAQPFLVPLTYYSGVEDGEAWSEGSREDLTYISGQPAGRYSLRLEVERENPQVGGPLTVRVEEGVAHFRTWFLAMIGVLLVPLGVGIYHLVFVGRRWQNSDFSMFNAETPGGGDSSGGSATESEPGSQVRERLQRERERRKKKGRK